MGNLLGLGQDQLVALVVEDQHLFLPYLIYLAGDDLADLLRIFFVKVGLLQIEDARSEILTQRQHGPTSERFKFDRIDVFVAHFVGRIDGLNLRYGDLHVRILHRAVLHDRTVSPDLQVALFRVDDHVEILVRLELLLKRVAENVLEDSDHRGLVDVFKLLELCEIADKIKIIHWFFILFIFEFPLFEIEVFLRVFDL